MLFIYIKYRKKIYCANLGDSRALYSENGSKEVYQISYEHKPQNEIKRIEKQEGLFFAVFLEISGDYFQGQLR